MFALPSPNTALFSDDRRHRLWLTRCKPDLFLNDGYGRAVFVMLNPSTADETSDDMTVKKCLGFAKPQGATEIGIVNLFTFCATEPRELLRCGERNHRDADAVIEHAFDWLRERHPNGRMRRVIFAYGSPPWAGLSASNASMWGELLRETAARVDFVRRLALARDLPPMCLGVTAEAWPRHPSRLGYDKGGDDNFQAVPPAHFAALGLEP